jgi:hypothetical protein
MKRPFLLAAMLSCSWPAMAHSDFLQDQGKSGQVRSLSGTVIHKHPQIGRFCYLIIADTHGRPGSKGWASGENFFICGKFLSLCPPQPWSGRAKQTGTQEWREGSVWQSLPVFEVTPL